MAIKRGNSLANKIEGTSLTDTIYGLGGNDKLEGLGGADTIYGGSGTDKIEGGAGNDTLYGEAGNDKIEGNAGADKLFGGAGVDLLESGIGNDQMTGGLGRDQFVYYRGDDRDRILDFADNVDHIDLTDFNFAGVSAAKSFATQSGANVVFNFGSGDTLTINNITLAQLTAPDFIL